MTDATSRTATKRPAPSQDDTRFSVPRTAVDRVEVDGVQVFYRAAGQTNAPVILLLHGFPTSSFMFRELIPRPANDCRVIAPDLSGFGFSEVSPERKYPFTFDQLALTIEAFTRALRLDRYASPMYTATDLVVEVILEAARATVGDGGIPARTAND